MKIVNLISLFVYYWIFVVGQPSNDDLFVAVEKAAVEVNNKYVESAVNAINAIAGQVDWLRMIGIGMLDPNNNKDDGQDKYNEYSDEDAKRVKLQLSFVFRLVEEFSKGNKDFFVSSEEFLHDATEVNFLTVAGIQAVKPSDLKVFGNDATPTEKKVLVFLPNAGGGDALNNLVWTYRRANRLQNLILLTNKMDFTEDVQYSAAQLAEISYLREFIDCAVEEFIFVPPGAGAFVEESDLSDMYLYHIADFVGCTPEPVYASFPNNYASRAVYT